MIASLHLGAAVAYSSTLPERLQSLVGLFAFTVLAFLIGRLRGARKIPWRVIIWGIILMFAFAAIVLFVPKVLYAVQAAVQALLDFTKEGARMVFGNLTDIVV